MPFWFSVTMDEIDGIGHWASNTRREVYAAKIPKSVSLVLALALASLSALLGAHVFQAVVALAGFYVGEAYHVPWAGISVPSELQTKLFPFVESALVNLQAGPLVNLQAGPRVNQGVVNFLELLQQLWPFFWRVGELRFLSF